MYPRLVLIILLTLFSQSSYSLAGTEASPLVVGVRVNAPFVELDDDQGGIALELWQSVAAKLARDYRLVRYDNVQALLKATNDGEVDIAVGAITVTAERAAEVDFSHPFFRGGIGIATSGRSGWNRALAALASPAFLKAVGILMLVLLMVGMLVWLAERRRNAAQFGGRAIDGIGSGLWWSAVTMTTVGYGDKAPLTATGRGIALVWMFVSIITISGFTAAIASAFTVERLAARVENTDDLNRARIVTLAGTTSEEALRKHGIRYQTISDLAAGLDALRADQVDAVIYDAPVLQAALLARGDPHLLVLPQQLQQEDYAFALPLGSNLRKPLNAALLQALRGNDWPALVARYLGQP